MKTLTAKEFRTWGYNIVEERMSIVKGLPAAYYTLDKRLTAHQIEVLESYENIHVFEEYNQDEAFTSLVIGCSIVIDGELVECEDVCRVHDTYNTVCKKKKFTRAAVERVMIDNAMATPKSSVWDFYFEYFTERDLINAYLKEEEDNWKDLGAPATFFEYLCSVYEISKLKNGSWLLRVK